MKRALLLIVCVGMVATSYATQSRILSMGKHDAFFMDETSVFRNPANVNVYPNMILGATGEFRQEDDPVDTTSGSTGDYEALERSNRDPTDPFFGAILTYSFKGADAEATQHPMLSFGAIFNRPDPLLNYLMLDESVFGTEAAIIDSVGKYSLLDPLGKVDLMVGYALPGGGKLGVGGYLAFNSEKRSKRECSLYKVTAGANWPIGRSIDLEGSVGIGILNIRDDAHMDSTFAAGGDTVSYVIGDSIVLARNDISVEGDVRLFSAMTAINGDFVPHVGLKYVQLKGGDRTMLDVAAGVGLNVNIDKGFFWAGIEGLYEQRDKLDEDFSSSGIGARVSFGIERNVVWDWFVVRVGGMKKIMYVTENNNEGRWEQNPETDADDDLVGMGIGLNVENRLKFDILVAEDVVHTLTNLFSGPQHHVFTRIDATFSF